MGAWGHETFQDDIACDWIWSLQEASEPTEFLRECLKAWEDLDYVESEECCEILGAAETIYAIQNGVRGEVPVEFSEWVDEHQDLDIEPLIPLVHEGIEKVLSDISEMNELWAENEEEYGNWREWVEEIPRGLPLNS